MQRPQKEDAMITLQLSHEDAVLVRDQLARDARRPRRVLALVEELVTPKPVSEPFGAEALRPARSPS